jgi:uncharacterized repeat protein (TIGR03847 family)
MSDLELNPQIFTADYLGRPGERAFYLQARGSFGTHSYEIEKGQVVALADKLRELLSLVDPEDTINRTEPVRDPALGLEAPVTPDWRIGAIGLAYEEEADRVLVLMAPQEEQEAEEDAAQVDPFEATEAHRVLLRRDQVRAFVLHATAIVGEGRPICQLCGLPKDPEGHLCPASNGHRTFGN